MSYSDRKLLQVNPGDITPNIVVAQNGSGKYDSIIKAVAEVPKKNIQQFIIYVKAGVYNERFDIHKHVNYVMIYGDGTTKTVITNNVSVAFVIPKLTTFHTRTFTSSGLNFIAKDIGFENTAEAEGHQAVALRASDDIIAFYNYHFNGYQDTIYSHSCDNSIVIA
ncbi:Pectinesterase [Hibiscus syriacus]|uniref:Pectinesterase n=1 Tax=Hibiscus syriacus TaxID=106335 RepID=A0A6A2XLR0_HIBSY|nr:Pectinesterase [Hibiscus syriacus]